MQSQLNKFPQVQRSAILKHAITSQSGAVQLSGFRELSTGERWLQTTAPISPGSSGGPLLLSDGTLAGVTTLSFKDAQNLNFAVPVSKVRAFLSSPCQPHDLAKGAIIDFFGNGDFTSMMTVLELPSAAYSSTEKHAGELLVKARQEVKEWALDQSEENVKHYQQAIALALEAEVALPDEFKYLAHYIIGEANVHLALLAGSTGKTAEERRARYRASDYSKAAFRHLMQATKIKPDFSPPLESLVRHQQYSGNWPSALLLSDRLVKLMPRCAEALQLRAKCYVELDQPESAKNDLEAAIELAPADGFLHCDLGLVFYTGLHQYSEAITCFERALKLGCPPSMVRLNVAFVYEAAGDFRKAIAAFELAKAEGDPADLCDREIAKCKQRLR